MAAERARCAKCELRVEGSKAAIACRCSDFDSLNQPMPPARIELAHAV